MNFELTEDQLQIKTSVREFAESELKPNVMEWDEAQHLPLEIFPQLAELGLLGIIFPEEYGGAVYIAAHKTQAARLALRF